MKFSLSPNINKKADTAPALATFIEVILVATLLILSYYSLTNQLKGDEPVKAEYAILYSYYTTLIGASPDDVLLISDERKDYDVAHYRESSNLIGVIDHGKDYTSGYIAFPYILPNFDQEFKPSYAHDVIYFQNYKESLYMHNLEK